MTEPRGTLVLAGKQMSSSLKERLKRAGRCYTSPCVKKLKVSTPQKSDDIHLDDADIPDIAEISEQSQQATNTSSAGHCPSDNNKGTGIKAETSSLASENTESEAKLMDTETLQSTKTFKSSLASTPLSSKSTAKKISSHSQGEPGPSNSTSSRQTFSDYKQIQQRIKQKEEKLRKLKLVKVHRSKNDLEKLDELTQKWKKASQMALEELWESSTGDPKPTLTQIVDHFSLDHKMLDYDSEEETFT